MPGGSSVHIVPCACAAVQMSFLDGETQGAECEDGPVGTPPTFVGGSRCSTRMQPADLKSPIRCRPPLAMQVRQMDHHLASLVRDGGPLSLQTVRRACGTTSDADAAANSGHSTGKAHRSREGVRDGQARNCRSRSDFVSMLAHLPLAYRFRNRKSSSPQR